MVRPITGLEKCRDRQTDRVCDIMKALVIHTVALKTNYKAFDHATFLRVETMEVDDFCRLAVYCHDGGDVRSGGGGPAVLAAVVAVVADAVAASKENSSKEQ